MIKRHFAPMFLAATALATSASGYDSKAFPGMNCKPAPGTLESGIDYSNGAMGAEGTGFDIICPVPRDRVNDASSLHHVSTEVFINQPTSTSITCTVYSLTEDKTTSSYIVDSDDDTTTSGGGNWQQLTMYPDASSSGNEGAYYMECDLKAWAKLFHYTVAENTTADE